MKQVRDSIQVCKQITDKGNWLFIVFKDILKDHSLNFCQKLLLLVYVNIKCQSPETRSNCPKIIDYPVFLVILHYLNTQGLAAMIG